MGILAATTTVAAIMARDIGTITPAITTAFSPAATCLDNQLTMLENQAFKIWLNYPLPVPASTFSACYPSQFMSSIVASAAGTTQAAFNPLVCPRGYTTVLTSWPAASNYIACCPSSYGLAPNNAAPSTRPAYKATCFSNLPFGSTLQMTLYGESSLSNTNGFSVSASTMQAYAIPYEGFADNGKAAAPVPAPASPTSTPAAPKSAPADTTSSPISAPAATTSSSSTARAATHASAPISDSTATTSTSSTAPAATYIVFATDTFSPNTINAQAGDTVVFQFQSGNHSLTQSTFDAPCEPLAGGEDSGFIPNLNGQVPFPSYTLPVNTTDPRWFYSKGQGDCANGMIFGLNPNSTETAAEFEGVAMAEAAPAAESKSPAAEDKSSGGNSKALEIGVSLGVIIFALLVAAAFAAFVVHRRRRGIRIPELDHYAAEHKDYNQADIKPLAPKENYELETIQAKENNYVALRQENNHVALRHELASLPAELA